MKQYSSFLGLLLLALSSPSFAQQGASCETGTERMTAIAGALAMEACLEKVATPANVEEEQLRHKTALCAQNAKNKELHGNAIGSYEQVCMKKNDAADVFAKYPA